jgi:hypothetical protein
MRGSYDRTTVKTAMLVMLQVMLRLRRDNLRCVVMRVVRAGECDSSQAAPKRVSVAGEVLVGRKRTSKSGKWRSEGKEQEQ